MRSSVQQIGLRFGAYKILHEHKKRIPEEVSVAAFGGYDESTLLTPELTTLKLIPMEWDTLERKRSLR